jgi:hypothetical protein
MNTRMTDDDAATFSFCWKYITGFTLERASGLRSHGVVCACAVVVDCHVFFCTGTGVYVLAALQFTTEYVCLLALHEWLYLCLDLNLCGFPLYRTSYVSCNKRDVLWIHLTFCIIYQCKV